jgi:hypothetical protein
MKFCVITAGEILPDFAALSAAIAAAFTLDRDTAAIRTRHGWGILDTDLEETAANALVGKCAGFGVKTLKLPAEALKALPGVLPLKQIGLEPGRFTWTGGAARTGSDWTDVLALSAAPIKVATTHLVKTTEGPSIQERAIRLGIMAVGLPVGFGKTREVNKEITGSDLVFYLDILLKTDKLRLRLDPANFDFSCLKEKKTYSSQTNFRVLCAELSAHAPGALRNTGLRAILEGKPLSALPYDSLEDLEKETRRLAALSYKP